MLVPQPNCECYTENSASGPRFLPLSWGIISDHPVRKGPLAPWNHILRIEANLHPALTKSLADYTDGLRQSSQHTLEVVIIPWLQIKKVRLSNLSRRLG